MKVVIFGSRNAANPDDLHRALASSNKLFLIKEVVSGGARGADSLGEQWARQNNIRCSVFSAEWDRFGKSAGYVRNADMAKYADFGIALWDGQSRGTANMIELMKNRVFVWRISI